MAANLRDMHLFLRRFLSPAVLVILVVNVAIFLLYAILSPFSQHIALFFKLLMQIPALAAGHFFVWQFVTYMFMHADPFHLIFNMLVLWFFASRLEYRWGSTRFVRFYFTVGICSGLFHTALAYLSGNPYTPMLGSSGAMYGIMLAYALYWPNDTVYLYMAIPVKIKYLMLFLGLFAFLASLSGGGTAGGISHVTHLGGFVTAFIYLKGWHHLGLGGGPRNGPPRSWRHPDYR